MKVMTFSRFFPAYHPRKGEPTYFMERIWKQIKTGNHRDGEYSINTNVPRQMKDGHWQLPHLWRDQMCDDEFFPKFHTIRAGNRWKVGDKISARVWTDKPYQSKQHEFAQLEVKKTWPIEVEVFKTFGYAIYVGKLYVCDWEINTGNNYLPYLATNDGLTKEDFLSWFKLDNEKPMPFSGQIICWNESVEYKTNSKK